MGKKKKKRVRCNEYEGGGYCCSFFGKPGEKHACFVSVEDGGPGPVTVVEDVRVPSGVVYAWSIDDGPESGIAGPYWEGWLEDEEMAALCDVLAYDSKSAAAGYLVWESPSALLATRTLGYVKQTVERFE